LAALLYFAKEANIRKIESLVSLEVEEMNNYRKSQKEEGIKEFRIDKFHQWPNYG
tara:strand:- start:961 stop:1125 length:165 start_codon:yes stop_codon:yes gene_type:complete